MTGLRSALGAALLGHLCLALVAVRHRFFWGAGHGWAGVPLTTLLDAAEVAGLLAFTALGALGCYRAVARAGQATPGSLLAHGIGVAVAAALVPPFLSSDVFDYVARGRVEAHHGANPYVVPPSAFAGDEVMRHAEWPDFVMPYGPISAILQALVAAVAGDRVWVGVYAFKLLGAGCHAATGWALFAAAERLRAPWSRQLLALYLFHPWCALEVAGSAHNDGLMALFLALTAWSMAADRWAAAAVAFAAAVGTKHGCTPFGPVLLAAAWRARRLPAFAAGAALALALALPLALRYFTAPDSLRFLSAQTGNRGASLQYFVDLALGGGFSAHALAVGYGLTLLALALALRRLRSVEDAGRLGIAVLQVFILCAMPLFSPWYHLWWIPLVALLPDARAAAVHALGWLAVCGPASYLVYVGTRSLGPGHQAWTWVSACATPLLLGLWSARRSSSGRSLD
jgi:hypothetical protein